MSVLDDDPQDGSPSVSYSDAECRNASDLFRTLGDVARFKTLLLLAQQELCVTDLAAALKEGLSTVSQRLRLLRSERLVIQRRSGKNVYYSLADQRIARLMNHALEEPENA